MNQITYIGTSAGRNYRYHPEYYNFCLDLRFGFVSRRWRRPYSAFSACHIGRFRRECCTCCHCRFLRTDSRCPKIWNHFLMNRILPGLLRLQSVWLRVYFYHCIEQITICGHFRAIGSKHFAIHRKFLLTVVRRKWQLCLIFWFGLA